jgi:hypothetical protein
MLRFRTPVLQLYWPPTEVDTAGNCASLDVMPGFKTLRNPDSIFITSGRVEYIANKGDKTHLETKQVWAMGRVGWV